MIEELDIPDALLDSVNPVEAKLILKLNQVIQHLNALSHPDFRVPFVKEGPEFNQTIPPQCSGSEGLI